MMSDLFSLQGKRILVTGSTRGIGLLLAQGLAEHGAEVIIHGTKPEQAQAVAEQLAEKGFKTHALAFDVTDSQAVRQAIDFIENFYTPETVSPEATEKSVTFGEILGKIENFFRSFLKQKAKL